jgi:PAS domain S-box-containing protein
MSHKDKISTSGKSIYILILGTGLVMALAILLSLFMGLRTNFLNSTLLNSALKIKSNILKARMGFTQDINQPSAEAVKSALESLEFVEYNARVVLEQNDRTNVIFIPMSDVALQGSVQKLQAQLFDYRALSVKISSQDKSTLDAALINEWENLFQQIESQSDRIESQIHSLLRRQINNFRVTQFVLIGVSLILCFITIFLIYRSEKNRIRFIRKIESANLDLEIGLRKNTRVEEALQNSRRQLDTLIQNLPGMVYRTRCESSWAFEFVSDKCLTLTGYKANDLINNKVVSYYDLIHPEDKRKVIEQIQHAVEEKKPYQLVYRIKTTGDYEKWVWEQGVGIFSEKDDDLVALEGFVIDITEQKAIEDQLEVQSNALEAAANGIVIMDNVGKVIWCNSAFTNLTGYTLNELIGKELNILKAESFPEQIYEYMWTTATNGDIWHGEIVNRKKDGSLYNEEMTITPIKDSLGKIKYFVSIKQDITERKKSEEALRESELRFRGLFENATIGIYRTSFDGRILMANPTLIKLFGYDSFEDISKVSAKLTYADPKTRDIFQSELMKHGNIFGFESQWRKKDGTIIFVRESARSVKDESGNVLYYEGTVEDISDKKKTEEALVEAKEHAEQSDNLKSEFLAQMSHEIRTPLNVILSFTGIMKDELQEQVDDELKNAFDVIEDEGKRIMRTVELILNMSELQTGSYSYRAKQIDLFKDVLQKVHKNFQIIADEKKILFGLYNNCSNTTIEADEYSINQIFHHLVDNALKYTPSGKVDLTIARDPRGNLYVDVSDTGIGITEEFLPNLFAPFTREEKGYTRNYEGNGLGLALAKKYCELNGADIKVTSVKDKGTTFRVTFQNRS